MQEWLCTVSHNYLLCAKEKKKRERIQDENKQTYHTNSGKIREGGGGERTQTKVTAAFNRALTISNQRARGIVRIAANQLGPLPGATHVLYIRIYDHIIVFVVARRCVTK